jgi:hypothetical protein
LAAEFRWHPQLKQKVRRRMENWTPVFFGRGAIFEFFKTVSSLWR